ncbi:MAG: nucleoside-diphosphate sugar epimerase/dehydratase [Desulfococcaceae bacterium]|jgi:FlaA1/EpsC-like NDP-sugar epimerase|nr:nucleoside-diphosphate sugar epimerase/dehydratase [Desulfococcaceae bacterium]
MNSSPVCSEWNNGSRNICKPSLSARFFNGVRYRFTPLISTFNFYIILSADILLFALAHFLSYCIRFEFHFTGNAWQQMISVLIFLLPLKAFVFWAFGLYLGMWRYAGVSDLLRLFKATVFASLVMVTAMVFIHRFSGYSRAVFIMDGCLTFLFAGGLRFGIRLLFHRNKTKESFHGAARNPHPVFIIGAGSTGEMTLREIMANPDSQYQVLGFIDDEPKKKGRLIHDIPVLGGLASLSAYADFYGVNEVLIAVPSASGAEMRKIIQACNACSLKYQTLPGWSEIINGKVSIKALRDVDYKDLLRRPPVQLHQDQIQQYLGGKTVLVSGAGGSIGSELCRQILHFQPGHLVLLDNCENNLYSMQMELIHRIGFSNCTPVLADVQDRWLMDRIFSRYRPHAVFHAAAYKHVPMMENNPWQAVHNNIRGTFTIMEQSVKHKTEYFLLISTDKAVRPTNVMGASKRVCELILKSFAGNGTRMMAVRFGNVLASSGSVIPLFRSQIAAGGPVTVTHPEVTRYFMTIPEAVQLVLQAGSQGEGGEIFILDMGTPVKIADMARDLIRFSGKEPDRDIEIVFTGLRPGEKLYEELITAGEGIVSTVHEKIMVLKSEEGPGAYGRQEEYRAWLCKELEEMYDLALRQDVCGIKKKLKYLVPEYTVQDAECVL